jgi:hypothetical protein
LGSVLNQLVKQTAEITEQVKLNTQLLQEVVKRQRCLNKDKVGPLPSNCQLPLHSFDELVAIEQQLKSKDFYSRLVRCVLIST